MRLPNDYRVIAAGYSLRNRNQRIHARGAASRQIRSPLPTPAMPISHATRRPGALPITLEQVPQTPNEVEGLPQNLWAELRFS